MHLNELHEALITKKSILCISSQSPVLPWKKLQSLSCVSFMINGLFKGQKEIYKNFHFYTDVLIYLNDCAFYKLFLVSSLYYEIS